MIELLEWQRDSQQRVVSILGPGGMLALDFSDVGSGKTFVAIASLKTMGRPALVICPKTVISNWRAVADLFEAGHLLLDVINWEKLQTGKTQWFNDKGWCLPEGAILVVDEVHKGCAGPKTATTKALALTKAYKVPVLAMSATPADSPLKLRALGYLAGLHKFNKASFYDFCARRGCYRNKRGGVSFVGGPKGAAIMAKINEQLASMMTRIRVSEIPGFPECDTQAELIDLTPEDRTAVNEAYAEMMANLVKPNSNQMVEILRARQIAELHKVCVLKQMVLDTLENEQSAAVFVNFRDTMRALQEMIEAEGHSVALVHGVQGEKEQAARNQAIADFQANKKHVILLMCQAGGVGVSLHDLKGRPRRAFITPSYNAVEFKQCLGRIHRAGSLSKAVQTIVLAAGTVEERVYRSIVGKLSNIQSIIDGDLEV